MAGRQRDPRTGRNTSGLVEGSNHGGTEGTSLVDVRTSQRMSRNPSAQSSRRGSPEGRGLRRQIEWIMEDIRPRLEWKKRKETFPKPADWKNLTEKEKEEREKRLGNMSQALQSERRKSNVCIRCGKKGHGQYTCTAPKPVISSTSRKRKSPENSDNKEEEENPRKNKSREERITALERMIASMKKNTPKKKERVFEIEDEEDMEDA